MWALQMVRGILRLIKTDRRKDERIRLGSLGKGVNELVFEIILG